MAVQQEHMRLWNQVFPLLLDMAPGRVCIIGVQDDLPRGGLVRDRFEEAGWDADELDLHDPRANIVHDLNEGVVWEICRRYDVVFDIGSLEHVANSHKALETYLLMLKPGGKLMLLTPIKGYYDHGFHTFSHEYIASTMAANRMPVEHVWYLDKRGPVISSPDEADDVCIVGIWRNDGFSMPLKTVQQKRWVK